MRSIQGQVVERFPGLPTRALGQKNVPGIAQCLELEHATEINADQIAQAGRELMEAEVAGPARTQWAWIPPRFFVS